MGHVTNVRGTIQRYTSARTGELMLVIDWKNHAQPLVTGTSPARLIKVETSGDDMTVVGEVRDRQGPALRFHADGREEHLADVKVELLR